MFLSFRYKNTPNISDFSPQISTNLFLFLSFLIVFFFSFINELDDILNPLFINSFQYKFSICGFFFKLNSGKIKLLIFIIDGCKVYLKGS